MSNFDMSAFAHEYATIEDLSRWADSVMSSRPADFVIGGDYLERWYVVPRSGFCNVYLHRFRRGDDDRALHDHPWDNTSVVISGRYVEVTPEGEFLREAGAVISRPATARHRVVLLPDDNWPVVTLFFTGPKVRDWGFWCGPDGERFVPWEEFTAPGDPGSIGPGCGE